MNFGLRTVYVDGSRAYLLPAAPQHVGDRRNDNLHGGVLAAAVDEAVRSHLNEAGITGVETVELTVDFVRPAALVDTYLSVDVVKAGRRFVSIRAQLWQDDTRSIVSTAQGTYRVTDRANHPR